MTELPAIRYSTGSRPIGNAKNFSWEYPIPRCPFWDDLEFATGRNFPSVYSREDIGKLPIDPDSTDDRQTKLNLLLKLLRERSAEKEAGAAPETYLEVDSKGWSTLHLGIYTVQYALGLRGEAEQTVRVMVDKTEGNTKLSHSHTLAAVLLAKGDCVEAEKLEKPVRAWLVGLLGQDSPQALGAMRTIVRAVWRQGPGRRAEAKGLIAEWKETVDGMGGGQYGAYQDEEREMMDKIVSELDEEEHKD
ncbi:hypothetical protein PT974_08274 [Cladobotryum mycophilum]|uniref:Uncharacterized protein n=1 Tax=Cladobotryum mycophilum TaxID=491253 RepID=A0ABR0SCY4_9HYPO